MKKIVPAPYIDQTERWVNGCESISSVMLLQAVGIDIDPDTFIARDLPHAPYWEQDALHRQGPEQRSGTRGRSRQVRSRGRERQDGGRALLLYRRWDAGGVLGDAGFPARAGKA